MKKPPYTFVVDVLKPLGIRYEPMFGAHAICQGSKVLVILRKKASADLDTGVWFGIPDEFVSDIKNEFPILKNITLFGEPPTVWQVIRESEPEFKETVLALCQLILKYDQRIGRIPILKTPGKPKMVIPKKIKVKK